MAYNSWCFTINNPTAADKPEGWPDVSYLIYQQEEGANKTPHLQGYVVFKQSKRLAALKKLHATAHWEQRMGTHEQAQAYCSKDDTRIAGTSYVELGSYRGKRKADLNDDEPTAKKAKQTGIQRANEIIESGGSITEVRKECYGTWLRYRNSLNDHISDVVGKRNWTTKLIILWGDTGTGKSKWCNDNFPDAYWLPRGQWWDGYHTHKTVVVDDFYGWFPVDQFLRICDCYPLLLPIKGSHVQFQAETIIFTSNKPWTEWYKVMLPEHIPSVARRITEEYHFSKVGQDVLVEQKQEDGTWLTIVRNNQLVIPL